MSDESRDNLTQILKRAFSGDRKDMDALLTAVYDDLRALAGHHLAGERCDHTLQPTAVVHEAYLRLIDQNNVQLEDRSHFFALASQMIRRILVDHARAHKAQKRGGGGHRVVVSDIDIIAEDNAVDLVALDDALQRLAELSPLQASVVELRFFGGLTIEEIAGVLNKGRRSIDREWQGARAWLFHALSENA